MNSVIRAFTYAAATVLPTMLVAQPLPITVNPLAVPGQILALPGQIISAPFAAFGPTPSDVYDSAPAKAAAVAYTPDGLAIVAAPVLRQTGPRYDNPAQADYRRPIVIRRGSGVPGFIRTAPLENVSVPGLVPGAHYDFFVAPDQKIVVVEPSTRQVVRILR